MNKLIVALVAGLFATFVFAQIAAPATPAAVKAEAKADKSKAVARNHKAKAKADTAAVKAEGKADEKAAGAK